MQVTMREARAATAALTDNMDALRHTFLFRGGFNRRGYSDEAEGSPAGTAQWDGIALHAHRGPR